jgi:sigma-B regulation protein RsbU (phosphoserine phosphatase)
MLTIVLAPLLGEYRAHRMARFAFWVGAYGAALWLVDRLAGGVPGLLWFLFWITFLVSVGYYVGRLIGFIRDRMLWRLRRRLIVAYLFIAVVPILLIVLLVGLGAFIVNGQFAAFLVTLRVREHVEELRQINRVVAHEAHLARDTDPEVLLDRLQHFYVDELSEHAASYPGLEITVRLGSQARAFRLDGGKIEKPLTLPAWLKQEEFSGIAMDHGQLALRAVDQVLTGTGNLVLILSEPITPQLMDIVGAGIGPVGVVTTRQAGPEAARPPSEPRVRVQTPEGAYVDSATISSQSVQLPTPASRLDFAVFGASTLDPVVWGGEQEQRLKEPVFVYVTSRLVTLNRQLLSTLGRFSHLYVVAFLVVAGVFLVIELVALLIGVRVTGSITRTVDNLYDATERVKAGDLSYRIDLPARDQLSALGKAFDGMTASVERLLRESQEKLRLEGELEIARQVQSQLFPRSTPRIVGLELYAACRPARVVSGDYYDFLQFGEERIGLVLGDIAGKGISAALLMAAIQSSLRAQFSNGFSAARVGEAVPISTAETVRRLNRQLYESTSVEKFATFFYAVYDGATRRLTYTNAGHLPPVLFRRDSIQRLGTGGTVVGLFSPTDYEQAVVQLEPGDVLLAFTDGMTEPENIYGEEYGEERLLDVARRALDSSLEMLADEIYRSVDDWTGSPEELHDDMTVVVARAIK